MKLETGYQKRRISGIRYNPMQDSSTHVITNPLAPSCTGHVYVAVQLQVQLERGYVRGGKRGPPPELRHPVREARAGGDRNRSLRGDADRLRFNLFIYFKFIF